MENSIEMPSPEVEEILENIKEGKSVILHGPGGTGKTYCLREVAARLQDMGVMVGCTATTGIAAVNLNNPEKKIAASTLHCWAGVGLARSAPRRLLSRVMHHEKTRDRWRETEVLVIDEVSMLGAEFYDKLDYIARHIRSQQGKPFGGLQLILSGDFFQLPPVKDKWIFTSQNWKELERKMEWIDFLEPKRYDDLSYFDLLLRVRTGKQTPEDLKRLRRRVKAYDKLQQVLAKAEGVDVIKPTTLFSRRVDVDFFNEDELEKLEGKTQYFRCTDMFMPYSKTAREDSYTKLLDDIIPKTVGLKVGAQVMLKCNLDVKAGLVNGSRGVVLEIDPLGEYVQVRFISGQSRRIAKHPWTVEDKQGLAGRTQIPLILAYALTIHKGQGGTLDFAVCDLGPSIFECGQAYVALSRVRNLKGLFISDFYPPSVQVNKSVIKYLKKKENYTPETPLPTKDEEDSNEM